MTPHAAVDEEGEAAEAAAFEAHAGEGEMLVGTGCWWVLDVGVRCYVGLAVVRSKE